MISESKKHTYGIYSWFGYILPFNELMRSIRYAGFDAVSIWWGDDFKELFGKKELQAEYVRKSGLVLENAHLPYINADLMAKDSIAGEEAFSYYIKSISSAASSEINTLVMHPPKYEDSDSYKTAAVRLSKLADHALKKGVDIAFENVFETVTVSYVLDMLYDYPNVGLCLDSGHYNISEAQGDFSVLKKYSDRLIALHLHDNCGIRDEHAIPFCGQVNWQGLMDILKKIGYKKSLMLESCRTFDTSFVDNDSVGAVDYLKKAVYSCRKLDEI